MTIPQTPKWMWMMDWCRRNGLNPSRTHVWEQAEKAYKEAIKEQS